MDNDLFFEAAMLVSEHGFGSITLLIYEGGFEREDAEALIEALQDEGILEQGEHEPLDLLRPIGFY